MKPHGATVEFSRAREDELLAARRNAILRHPGEPDSAILTATVNTPCSRFWVSETRALEVIRKIDAGDPLNYMRPLKRAMYLEIHTRLRAILRLCPDISMLDALSSVIHSQAPRFYMMESYALRIIKKAIRQKRRLQNQRK